MQLINSGNLSGLTSKNPWSKDTYYQKYQKSFKDGEYNLKEPVHTPYGQTIRSYFSGGTTFDTQAMSSAIQAGMVVQGKSDVDFADILVSSSVNRDIIPYIPAQAEVDVGGAVPKVSDISVLLNKPSETRASSDIFSKSSPIKKRLFTFILTAIIGFFSLIYPFTSTAANTISESGISQNSIEWNQYKVSNEFGKKYVFSVAGKAPDYIIWMVWSLIKSHVIKQSIVISRSDNIQKIEDIKEIQVFDNMDDIDTGNNTLSLKGFLKYMFSLNIEPWQWQVIIKYLMNLGFKEQDIRKKMYNLIANRYGNNENIWGVLSCIPGADIYDLSRLTELITWHNPDLLKGGVDYLCTIVELGKLQFYGIEGHIQLVNSLLGIINFNSVIEITDNNPARFVVALRLIGEQLEKDKQTIKQSGKSGQLESLTDAFGWLALLAGQGAHERDPQNPANNYIDMRVFTELTGIWKNDLEMGRDIESELVCSDINWFLSRLAGIEPGEKGIKLNANQIGILLNSVNPGDNLRSVKESIKNTGNGELIGVINSIPEPKLIRVDRSSSSLSSVPASVSFNSSPVSDKGGIDFGAMPIVTQPLITPQNNLRLNFDSLL